MLDHRPCFICSINGKDKKGMGEGGEKESGVGIASCNYANDNEDTSWAAL